jgi:hypothetical protein
MNWESHTETRTMIMLWLPVRLGSTGDWWLLFQWMLFIDIMRGIDFTFSGLEVARCLSSLVVRGCTRTSQLMIFEKVHVSKHDVSYGLVFSGIVVLHYMPHSIAMSVHVNGSTGGLRLTLHAIHGSTWRHAMATNNK